MTTFNVLRPDPVIEMYWRELLDIGPLDDMLKPVRFELPQEELHHETKIGCAKAA